MDLVEMTEICSNNQQTIEFLWNNGLLKRSYWCCHQQCIEIKNRTSDGKEFKCSVCEARYSIRSESFFFNVHISLRYLLLLLYLFACNTSHGLTSKFFGTKVSHRFIGQWYDKLCGVMRRYISRHPVRLGGPETIVELDETALGRKRKYHRGTPRGSGLKWVLGLIDRTTKKCHLEIVQNRNRNILFPIINRTVHPETVIHSDEAAVYTTLADDLGFEHYMVKHKETYVAPDGTHTNTIENFWTHLKNNLKEKHGVANDKLKLHLNEFTWRWNRKTEGNAFNLLMADIAVQYPL